MRRFISGQKKLFLKYRKLGNKFKQNFELSFRLKEAELEVFTSFFW